MSRFSDLLNSFMKDLDDAGKKLDQAFKDAGIEKKDIEAAAKKNAEENKPDPAPAAASGTADATEFDGVPAEECQYNSGLSYLDYFSKIFREDFPQCSVSLETVEDCRRYKYTFTEGADVKLIVELMTENSEANRLRKTCERNGTPYLRFYFDHEGWWNTRRYVNARVSAALGI